MQVNYCFFVTKFQKTPKHDMSLFFIIPGFNSTLVWLKVFKRMSRDGKEYQFQFHIGLIKRHRCALWCIRHTKFQFHIGLIKRIHVECDTPEQTRFNSTLVWLKVILPRPWFQLLYMFQFHIGLIKSWFRVLTKHPSRVSIPHWSD